jgi:hypothetical protein
MRLTISSFYPGQTPLWVPLGPTYFQLIVNSTKSDSYFEEKIVLSEFKCFKIIKETFTELSSSIFKGIRAIRITIKSLYQTLKSKCKKSKRKKKKLPEDILKTTKSKEVENTELVS